MANLCINNRGNGAMLSDSCGNIMSWTRSLMNKSPCEPRMNYMPTMGSINPIQDERNMQVKMEFKAEKPMQSRPISPSTSPGMTNHYGVPAYTPPLTYGYDDLWIKNIPNGNISPASGYSTGTDDSLPRSLSSPEESNRRRHNYSPGYVPPSYIEHHYPVQRNSSSGLQGIRDLCDSYEPVKTEQLKPNFNYNIPAQNSHKSPSTSIDKYTLQKFQRRQKTLKKRQNDVERLKAESESHQYRDFERGTASPIHLSPTHNGSQEQINPSDCLQINMNVSGTTLRETSSPSGSSTISSENAPKKNKPFKDPVLLTEQVYRTEPGYMVPRFDSKGLINKFKCKKNKCDLLFNTKHELWIHTRVHLAGKHNYQCPEPYCAFVTEHMHHLEYHQCLHSGERKFKCDKCNYAAPNKATLTSHQKSHTDFYHYVCADCKAGYRYEHMFKQHLKKTGHVQGEVRNSNGDLVPDKVVDVYGKKRGPKTVKKNDQNSPNTKKTKLTPCNQSPMRQQCHPSDPMMHLSQLTNTIERTLSQHPYESPVRSFQPVCEAPLDLSASTAMNMTATDNIVEADSVEVNQQVVEEVEEAQVLNLSIKPVESVDNKPVDIGRRSGTNKRKGKAFKLVRRQDQNEISDEEDAIKTTDSPVAVNNPSPCINRRESFECEFCEVSFGQLVMYNDHMRYHNNQDPSVCEICHKRFSNQADFYLHIGRENHSQYVQ